MTFNQDNHPGSFHIKLIEGERAPEPRPLSHIESPPGKPPGGMITPRQLQDALNRAAARQNQAASSDRRLT